MINYILPGLIEHFNLNRAIIELKNQNSYMFKNDVNLYCTYGSYQFSIWDGGRVFGDYHQNSKEDIENSIKFYKDMGIKHRLICTNPMIEEKHLSNHFMNLVMKLCEDDGEVVVNSLILENYIRENYPGYRIISSTTKRLNSIELLNAELAKNQYYMVCLDYDLNKKFDELKKIENKDKCEFLINAICPPGCPNRKEHYRLNGISQLNFGMPYNIQCMIKENTLHPSTWNYKNNISPKEIEEIYVPMGFSNFKLEGRTLSDSEVLGNYVRYFVKDEYQLWVYAHIINKIHGV